VLAAALAVLSTASAQQPDLSSARPAAAALQQLHNLVVTHRGETAFEYYAKGYSATRQANIKSASKSIISALVGIAIQKKLIAGVDEPIVRWFPELRQDADKRKASITIEDLLTMRSGLQSTSGSDYGPWVRSQPFGGHRACFAWGFGGQYIFVFDRLELVVVVISATDVSDERRGYRRQLFDLLESHVLPRIEVRQGTEM